MTKEQNIIKTAVGYIRLSRDDLNNRNESKTLENQREHIIEYCKRKSITLLKIFDEGTGYSGDDPNKPQFNMMMKAAQKHLFDAIVIKDGSRFTRSPSIMQENIELLIALKIKLLTYMGDEELTVNPHITVLRTTLDWELILRGRKNQRMMLEQKQKEGGTFARPPYGYIACEILVDGHRKTAWKVDIEKASNVRKMYQRFIEGTPIRALAEDYDLGLQHIRNILKNRIYVGIRDYTKREKIIGKVDTRFSQDNTFLMNKNFAHTIVNKELFNQAQERFEMFSKKYINNMTLLKKGYSPIEKGKVLISEKQLSSPSIKSLPEKTLSTEEINGSNSSRSIES